MTRNSRRRPAGNGAASRQMPNHEDPAAILPPPVAGPRPALGGVDASGILDGVPVVVVRVDAGRYRRRVFLTLASAERAAVRARERGQAAEVVLCALAPLSTLGHRGRPR